MVLGRARACHSTILKKECATGFLSQGNMQDCLWHLFVCKNGAGLRKNCAATWASQFLLALFLYYGILLGTVLECSQQCRVSLFFQALKPPVVLCIFGELPEYTKITAQAVFLFF